METVSLNKTAMSGIFRRGMSIFSKPNLSVTRVSLLFGIHQLTLVCRATISFPR